MAGFEASTGPIVPLSARRGRFHGSGGALLGIYLRNILLTLVTLGAYYFWGKNRTRTYLAGQCEFDGDRFAWHGTGKELLIGALKLLVIAVPVVVLLFVVPIHWKGQVSKVLPNAVTFVIYVFLVPLAAIGARRYRLSRLSWRGIRFSFRGRGRDFLKLWLRGQILSAITLGLYYPIFQTNVRRFVSDHTYFGNTRFAFDGKGRDLFGRFLAALLITLVVFGVAVFWMIVGMKKLVPYRGALGRPMPLAPQEITGRIAAVLPLVGPLLGAVVVAAATWLTFVAFRHRYFWGHTMFGSARFRSTVTAAKLFALALTNIILLIVTVGLGFPWVMVRNMKFGFANISLEGSLDLSSVVQEAQAAGATSDSLATMLDIDFLGFDLPL